MFMEFHDSICKFPPRHTCDCLLRDLLEKSIQVIMTVLLGMHLTAIIILVCLSSTLTTKVNQLNKKMILFYHFLLHLSVHVQYYGGLMLKNFNPIFLRSKGPGYINYLLMKSELMEEKKSRRSELMAYEQQIMC